MTRKAAVPFFSPSAVSASSSCSGMDLVLVCWDSAPRRDMAPDCVEAFRVMNRKPEEILKEQLQQSNDFNALEKEASQGNPHAMKLLAKQLLQGEPSTEDRKLALSWYEKAAEQLPEDDDLEFEIFMLKMDIDNN